jgi:peptidoglycan/LPS O-acetylase OafA/YrhL
MDKKEFYLAEYESLKDEQLKRIEQRDHMIYLTLVAIGAVFSYALADDKHIVALLVLPFFCLAMGWTYYINDTKISTIGDYIKEKIVPQFETGESNWEHFRLDRKYRKFKKVIQNIVDISLFSGSSMVSILYFLKTNPSIEFETKILLLIAFVLILGLAIALYNRENNPTPPSQRTEKTA